ncbi:MAG: rRNA maturation RNase YbeY [Anaerolineae bacterium]
MSDYAVTLQHDIELPDSVTSAWLRGIARQALRHQRQPTGSQVALVLTDDATVAKLNAEYRHVDAPTDVLAFASQEGEPFVLPEAARRHLGDIVISLETAQRQASERDHPVGHELALLIVHGCLHLLGYDHGTPEEKARMWSVQRDIMQEILGDAYAP